MTHTLPKVVTLAEAQNWRCCYCTTTMTTAMGRPWSGVRPTDATIEHVRAQSSGGKTVWDNEVAACASCNSHRGHYSAALFWLLMLEHHHDRAKASHLIRSMSQTQRRNARRKLGEAHGWPTADHRMGQTPPPDQAQIAA